MNLPIFLCPFRPVVGEYYVDGGLTNNSPVTTAHTVRVSPTDRTADITPRRLSSSFPATMNSCAKCTRRATRTPRKTTTSSSRAGFGRGSDEGVEGFYNIWPLGILAMFSSWIYSTPEHGQSRSFRCFFCFCT